MRQVRPVRDRTGHTSRSTGEFVKRLGIMAATVAALGAVLAALIGPGVADAATTPGGTATFAAQARQAGLTPVQPRGVPRRDRGPRVQPAGPAGRDLQPRLLLHLGGPEIHRYAGQL